MTNYLLLYLFGCLLFLLMAGFLVLAIKINRPFRFIFWIMLCLLVPLIIIYYIVVYNQPMAETKTPYLIGLSATEAENIAAALNLRVVVSDQTYEPGIPANQVINQRPEPGRIVKQERTIYLIVGMGQKSIIVPNLVGKDFQQIEIVLKELGLELGNIEKINSQEFANQTIISQNPAAGEEISSGSAVNVVIAINEEEPNQNPDNQNETEQP